MRRRGLGSDGVDPVLVAAPVLVVLAFVVVVLRAAPGGAATRRRSGGRGSGLLPFTALARAARQPLAVALPLSTLLLGLGFAVFASGVLTTVAEGQERSAWHDVGADYLLEAEYFEEQDLDALADVPGVEQVVPALRREQATFFDPAGQATPGQRADRRRRRVRRPGGRRRRRSGVDPAAVRRLAGAGSTRRPRCRRSRPPRPGRPSPPTEGAIDPTASLGRTEVAVTAVPATFPLDGGLRPRRPRPAVGAGAGVVPDPAEHPAGARRSPGGGARARGGRGDGWSSG